MPKLTIEIPKQEDFGPNQETKIQGTMDDPKFGSHEVAVDISFGEAGRVLTKSYTKGPDGRKLPYVMPTNFVVRVDGYIPTIYAGRFGQGARINMMRKTRELQEGNT